MNALLPHEKEIIKKTNKVTDTHLKGCIHNSLNFPKDAEQIPMPGSHSQKYCTQRRFVHVQKERETV